MSIFVYNFDFPLRENLFSFHLESKSGGWGWGEMVTYIREGMPVDGIFRCKSWCSLIVSSVS